MKLCGLIKGNSAEVIQIITLSNVLCSKEDASFVGYFIGKDVIKFVINSISNCILIYYF